MSERKQLQSPYHYGPDLPLRDVRAGDVFDRDGDRAYGRMSGTITKVKRATFDYDTVYAPRPDFEQIMHLNARLSLLVGARIVRGDVVYIVTDGKPTAKDLTVGEFVRYWNEGEAYFANVTATEGDRIFVRLRVDKAEPIEVVAPAYVEKVK